MITKLEWHEADVEKPPAGFMVLVACEDGGWCNGQYDDEDRQWYPWEGTEPFRQPVKWWARVRTPSKFYNLR